jgi:hypothetical protein
LRDTAASLAIQEGQSVVAVARLLGHESAATTLNHYAGLFPTDLDDIASRLNAAIASQRASSDAKQSPTKHRPKKQRPVGEYLQTIAHLRRQECPRQSAADTLCAPGRIRTCGTSGMTT